MVKEIDEIQDHAKKAMKSLAAEFKFSQELLDQLKKIREETEQSELKQASHDSNLMIKIYKWIARAERKVAHDDDQLNELLNELGKILPEEHKNKEEEFKKQLMVVNAHLKKLASFYTGELKDKINDLEREEQLLPQLEKKNSNLQKIKLDVNQKMEELEANINELDKWIKANDVIVHLIIQWAEELERLAA